MRTRARLLLEETDTADRLADTQKALVDLEHVGVVFGSQRHAQRALRVGRWNHCYDMQQLSGSALPTWGGIELTANAVGADGPLFRQRGIRPGDFATGIAFQNYGLHQFRQFSNTGAFDVSAAQDIAWLFACPRREEMPTAVYVAIKSGFVGGPDWYLSIRDADGVRFTVDDGPNNAVASTFGIPAIGTPWVFGGVLERATNRARVGLCAIDGAAVVSAEIDASAVGSLSNAAGFIMGHGNAAAPLYVSHAMACHGVGAATGVSADLAGVLERYAAAVASVPSIVSTFAGRGRSFVAMSGHGYEGADVSAGDTLLTRDATVQAIVKWNVERQGAPALWTLLKTGGADAWDAGAASVQRIEGDCAVEFTIPRSWVSDMECFVGLSDSDAGVGYVSIDFALHASPSQRLRVRENGIEKFVGALNSYLPGDVLRVERRGDTVRYMRNGATFYTSLVSASSIGASLLVDCSILKVGASVIVRFLDGGDAPTAITWQGVENLDITVADHIGALYSRGSRGAVLSAGVELRATVASSRVGELAWRWRDMNGVERAQPGGQFVVADGYQLLTATRRWESPTKVVLRYFVGGEQIAEVESADGSIAGAASAETMIGARGLGGYPKTAAAMAAATRPNVQWSVGWLADETAGAMQPAFGLTALTAVGTPVYGVPGARAAVDSSDRAIRFDSTNDGFQAAAFNIAGAEDFAFAWVGFHKAYPLNVILNKYEGGGVGTGYYITGDGASTLYWRTQIGGPIDLNVWINDLPVGRRYAGIATIDRSTGRGRIAVCDEGGRVTISPEGVISAGDVTNTQPFSIGASPWLVGCPDMEISAAYVAHGVAACTGLSANLEEAVLNFASHCFGHTGAYLDGVIDELRVCDYEMSREEIEATWQRLSKHQPDGYRMMRDLMPPEIPISDDPGSRVQSDLRTMGSALGYASAQIENVRANIMPDRAYGEVQERWESITKQFPRPLDSLDVRRRRVLAHLSKRAGVSIPGVQSATDELLDTSESNVEIVAFDQTIAEDWLRLRSERWSTNDTGAELRKNGGVLSYNTGAAASHFFTGDCFVEWTVNATTHLRAVGLTADAAYSTDPGTFDYSIRQELTEYSPVENGVYPLGALTAVVIGDRLRIERRGSTVYYRKNGAIYYTSTIPSTLPLRVVVSMASVGARVTGLRAGTEFCNYTPIVWVNRTGADLLIFEPSIDPYGARIAKTGGGAAWDAGVSSVETCAGDCYVEAQIVLAASDQMIGLSADDVDVNFATIQYALYHNAAQLRVYESGVAKFGPVALAAGDVIAVRRRGSVVTYELNGSVVYTSLTPSSSPLRVDASLFHLNTSAFHNVKLFDAGGRRSITWQNAVNVTLDGESLRVQASGGEFPWDKNNPAGGLRAVMTAENPKAAGALVTDTIPPQAYNGCSIVAAVTPVALPANAEAGIVYWDWTHRQMFFFGLRNNGGVYQVGYQRYRSDAPGDAAFQVLAVTSATKHWFRFRQSISDAGILTQAEMNYDLSYSTLSSKELDFATVINIAWWRTIGWWGTYVRTFGVLGGALDVRFSDAKFRNRIGTRPFYFYALRDRALAGTPDYEAARAVVRRMRHAYTHASAIAQRSFLTDDSYSVTDGGPLGGV